MNGMSTLQSVLDEALGDAPYIMAAAVIGSKFETEGITLSRRELDRLAEHLRSNGDVPFRLSLRNWWKARAVSIDVGESDVEEIGDRLEKFVDEELTNIVRDMTVELSTSILQTLRRRWPREARRQNRELRGFRRRLRRRWSSAIGLLSMSVTIARELGEVATDMLRRTRGSDSPYLVEVLPRLHARSCQIATEVISLLESGFADGAMARWRTLHEIAAVAMLLKEHGEELARRYVDHRVVESYRAAADYRECSERLGYEALEESEYQEVRAAFDDMIARHGQGFETQYGWAAEVVGKRSPSIRDIEKRAGIDHLRAHYRMASHNVHANPKGVYFKLGLLDEGSVLLAGPSNFGFADPGHGAAISLLQVTAALCTVEPNLDTLVSLRILSSLVDEVGGSFLKAQSDLEQESG